MASDPAAYLAEIELALIASQIVTEYNVVRSWSNTDDGFIRVRAVLANGDFLETTEYFAIEQGNVATIDYRHQWMDASREIFRARWDCTPHHPEIDGFPDHVHLDNEERVVPGQKLGLIDLLQLLEQEMTAKRLQG